MGYSPWHCTLQAFSWRLQLKRKTHAWREGQHKIEVIYNVISEERYHHFHRILSVSRASLQDQGLRCRTAVKSSAGWGTGCSPQGRREGLLLPGLSVSHPGLQMDAF